MRRWQAVLCAAALDAVLGDPRWRGHPARLMGQLASALERPCRGTVADERTAGMLAAVLVIGSVATAASGIVWAGRRLHPRLGDVVSVALLYWALAARGLADHARAVSRALELEDLEGARQAVARMVGRDTEVLDEEGVVRAAVESVAENTVDGVLSPLLYAFLGGAPAAMAFKAVSTLDSTFGYKDDRYIRFGWASARLDDVANYLPARVAVPVLAAGAALLGRSPFRVVETVKRDGRRHASPNSGLAEAAFAGALGVRLGGPLQRGGQCIDLPYIGSAKSPLSRACIGRAVRLMWLGYGVALVVGVALSLRGNAGRR